MRNFRNLLKQKLPPRIGYRLRIAKALMVDADLQTLRALARKIGSKKMTAIDVGANCGIYASVLAKYFGRVICIEPNPECIAYLKQVLPSNCILVEGAASNEAGVAYLNIPILDDVEETTRGTISSRNSLTSVGATVREVPVTMFKLDSVIEKMGAELEGGVALLKVDVEGHEHEVIEGATRLLTQYRPVIFAELEERHGTAVKDVLLFLKSSGYRTADKTSLSSSPASEQPGDDSSVNRVFYPGGLPQTPRPVTVPGDKIDATLA